MDSTLKAPFVQGSRERCPGPTRQEPFVAYCYFSLRSPPPGSPTWSYRKLWSYRCPRPFTLCLPPFVHGPRGRCPGPTRQKPFGAYCPFPFARSPPPGCRRHPCGADRRAPTMSPPLYLSVSFPTGIVSSCTPTVSGARYASSVVLQKRLVLHGGLGPTAIFPFHSGTCAGPLAPAPWRSFPRGAWRVFSLELVCS